MENRFIARSSGKGTDFSKSNYLGLFPRLNIQRCKGLFSEITKEKSQSTDLDNICEEIITNMIPERNTYVFLFFKISLC